MLAEAASLPIMAVVSLVTAAVTSTITGTLAVVSFRTRQNDNARATKANADEVDRLRGQVDDLKKEIKEIGEWRLQSDRKHFAVERGLDDDSPIRRLWPVSKS